MSFSYFDYNATTPLWPEARAAWLEAESKYWYNASSLYREGASARHFLEELREDLADQLQVVPERVLFTSGATEANNAVFWDVLHRGIEKLSLSSLEHPSVREGARLRGLQVQEFNALEDPTDELKGQGVGLLSLMAANNESGLLLPWRAMAKAARAQGVLFHCDAVQWFGKIENLEASQVDYLTASAHKFGGTKGVGFLVIPEDERMHAFLKGGAQEVRRRAGTENVAGVAAMMTALEISQGKLQSGDLAMGRDTFEAEFKRVMPEVRVLHEQEERLWNTSLLVMPRHDQRKWVARLSQLGFAVSTGSACSAGSEGASRVAESLGLELEERRRVIRVSGGWQTRVQEWKDLLQAFQQVLIDLDQGTQTRVRL